MTLVRLIKQTATHGHITLRAPGQCPGCDQGWQALRTDARHGDNLQVARELWHRVKLYVSGHPRCTLHDLCRDLRCHDIRVYICLHLLVHDFQLTGPDPYACGAPQHHRAPTYRVLHLPGPPSGVEEIR